MEWKTWERDDGSVVFVPPAQMLPPPPMPLAQDMPDRDKIDCGLSYFRERARELGWFTLPPAT